MWFVFALLSAIFAALTSILAKVGIEGVNSNLATAIRTVVVVLMAWGMVFLTNAQNGLAQISRKSWIFLILSGLATGASWLCYYRALQIGDASKVVPIDKLSVVITLILAFVFLHESFSRTVSHLQFHLLTLCVPDQRSAFMACLYRPCCGDGNGYSVVEKGELVLPCLYSSGLCRDCRELGGSDFLRA